MAKDKMFTSVVARFASIDKEAFRISAVMTTTTRDRDGDIVEPAGIDLGNFLGAHKNPVVLWAHDKSVPPIARVLDITRNDTVMIADIEFDKNDPFAVRIFNKYVDGFMAGWSIGFKPKYEKMLPIRDDKGEITGLHFQEVELLELSAVPVPSNPQALARAYDGDRELFERCAKSFDGLPDALKTPSARKMYDDLLRKEIDDEDHTDATDKNEPAWATVEKGALPEIAGGEYAHHWVDNPQKNAEGQITRGRLLVHSVGLREAYRKALGVYGAERASDEVVEHLKAHLGENAEDVQFLRADEAGTHSEKEVAPGAFTKSFAERGSAGKIPTTFSIGKEAVTTVAFTAIQEKDGRVTEAKVLSVTGTIKAPATAPASGREGGNGTPTGVAPEAAKALDDDELRFKLQRAKALLLS